MKEKIYTIKNLCNELNQPRQKVRRRIEKLDIKAINEDTRIHGNEPLEYDHQVFLKLAEEFDVRIDNKECTASVQQRTANEQHRTAEETSKDKLIKILEEQLEEANKSRANLEKLLDLQQKYSNVYLVRNERIAELAIYTFDTGERFEPDFLLFLQEDKSEGYIQQQIYIEPKGSYLLETDKWKEEFLKEINDEAIPIVTYVDNNDYHIFGLPFYNTEYKIEEFTESMDNFLK